MDKTCYGPSQRAEMQNLFFFFGGGGGGGGKDNTCARVRTNKRA